ncbi:ABC transporter ATP-binding protein [Bacillus sp. M6-12]|uniref:ABC transporter ATP-binding protein n=1 Tax=Bacillus sp. M6-12 TaxID=2054166 RepID=UPI000C763E03|nr:ABC transporter ATP-binding protein [Bacillus sp. M6-12]PLS18406.1 ABC transporter ATP-binding protein [Bacillus sp. M6-12]
MAETLIRFENVSKVFGHQTVLSNITLEIKKGEIFGLLGPSGAGKTTLVKMLTGLESLTSGMIWMGDTSVPSISLMQRIGYMSQSDALYHELTAYENLEFFASLYGLSGKQRNQRIHHVMEIVNLQEHLKKTVRNFSGGMKRRLSLAAALLHNPKLLILDEPTVGIDPILRQSIWNNLRNLKENGVTILLTTHVMDEAEKCDRLALIRNGGIIASGSPENIRKSASAQTIEEAFLTLGGAGHEN